MFDPGSIIWPLTLGVMRRAWPELTTRPPIEAALARLHTDVHPEHFVRPPRFVVTVKPRFIADDQKMLCRRTQVWWKTPPKSSMFHAEGAALSQASEIREAQSFESCGRGRFPSASQRPIWNALVNSDEHLTRQVYHAQSRFGFRWIPHADSGQPCATGLELAGFRVQLSWQLRTFSRLATDRRRKKRRFPRSYQTSWLLQALHRSRRWQTWPGPPPVQPADSPG